MTRPNRMILLGMEHLDALVAMASALVLESPILQHFPFDEPRARAVLQNALSNHNGGGFGIMEESSKGEVLVGAVVFHTSALSFSAMQVAYDVIFYVSPGSRKSNYGIRLVRRYQQWAKERKLLPIVVSMSGISDRIESLYRRAGFIKMGLNLIGRNYHG